jgi:tetratricopeptide (TPR) repeat protein
MRTWFIAIVVAMARIWPTAVFSDDKPVEKPDTGPASKMPPIVCLHTEYMPLKEAAALKYRLMRELGRQALLIAARDELGLSTRDETLGEVFPDSVTQAKQDLYISVRNQFDGAVRFQLWLASKPEELLPTKKEKQHDPRVILNHVEKLEPRSRGDLCDKLRSFGFGAKVVPPNEKNVPSDAIEGQLLEMNFVSQFAAVRAAHAAIAEKGQSRAWLGVLARGYANLSLMTEHHWKSDTEVFAARALLYAERLAAANSENSLAIAHRAYVRAIVGLHGAALEDVKRVGELREKHTDQPALPNWFDLIEPYCSFQREPIIDVGQRRPSLRQLAQRLSFEQYRAFGDDRWLFDSAKQSMSICPEEYGIYAALTRGSGSLLSIVRTGANYAPVALAHFLPARIAALPDLPRGVADAANGLSNKEDDDKKGGDQKPKADGKEPAPDAESAGQYAAGTSPIIEALRMATKKDEDKGEPTWSALGELIFEEQFVQAANYLSIAMNATESSHEAEVKSMLPAVKGHRYARHIESYVTSGRCAEPDYIQVMGDLKVVDPRGNMQPMMRRMWGLKDDKGRYRRGHDDSWCGYFDRSLTFNGLLEAYSSSVDTWWDETDAGLRKRWANDFHTISPHSPQSLRLEIAIAKEPTYEQYIQWESEAGDDPTVCSWLGSYFAAGQHYEDATRAYERSIKLSPSKDAYVGLAYAYRDAGQEDKWLPTLERFFEVESLGLEHAAVHQIIANDFIDKGKWEEAESHATAAAETWAAWGLELASRVDEGLGRWEESEKWIREEANAYPSSSADEWYFWCRRTGRGNLEEARAQMQTYIKQEWIKTNVDGQLKVFTYHSAENDLKAAFEDAKNIVNLAEEHHESDDMDYYQLHLALAGRALKETDVTTTAIKEVRELSEKTREKHPNLSAFNIAICDILDGKTIPDDTRADIVAKMERQPKEVRCNCNYFLGRAYDLAGNKELAEQYWKQCVTRGPFGRYNATLAGKYLSDRNKTSRP